MLARVGQQLQGVLAAEHRVGPGAGASFPVQGQRSSRRPCSRSTEIWASRKLTSSGNAARSASTADDSDRGSAS